MYDDRRRSRRRSLLESVLAVGIALVETLLMNTQNLAVAVWALAEAIVGSVDGSTKCLMRRTRIEAQAAQLIRLYEMR